MKTRIIYRIQENAASLMNRKRTSQRVYRDLTPSEQTKLAQARAETEVVRQEILAEGHERKAASLAISRSQHQAAEPKAAAGLPQSKVPSPRYHFVRRLDRRCKNHRNSKHRQFLP